MRVIFMGTPDFAVETLKAVAAEHEIVAVFCQPDKPKGRSGKLAFPPVKEAALELGLNVYQPVKIREQEYQDIIKELNADIAVVVAFGQILPQTILDMPKYGCINVHASLLPMYRGAAPIQWSILNGDEKTGITIQQMDKGLDTGDILSVKEYIIDPKETSDSLFEKLSHMGGPLVLETIRNIEAGTATRTPQGEATTDYARMMTKEMALINWTESAVIIERKVRAFNSWPCAYTMLAELPLKIWSADVVEHSTGLMPGQIEVTKNNFYVQTGDGCLELKEVQLSGKKRMPADAFMRGVKLNTGDRLGE